MYCKRGHGLSVLFIIAFCKVLSKRRSLHRSFDQPKFILKAIIFLRLPSSPRNDPPPSDDRSGRRPQEYFFEVFLPKGFWPFGAPPLKTPRDHGRSGNPRTSCGREKRLSHKSPKGYNWDDLTLFQPKHIQHRTPHIYEVFARWFECD